MKRYHIGILSLFVAGTLSAQNTVKMSAVKSNDYGVAYTLPKTAIQVKAEATKTTRKAGEYYEYAERYLNISNPITEDNINFTLTNVEASTVGFPDKSNSYLVEFKSNSTAPYVTLTKDGMICAINADAQFDSDKQENTTNTNSKPLPNPRSFLTEEVLRAGSKSKQAELIAKQILQLRETRTNILTGEADNMPPDGDAYKLVMSRIDEQEKALTSMFAGTETIEEVSKNYTVNILDKNIDRQIVFRFSKKLGFVGENDLSGAPVYLTLINKDPKEAPILSPKEQKDLEKKFSKGIIYNIPAKASLKIEFDNKAWVNKEIDVVQFGTQEVLTPQMFDNNKQPIKVIFYPDLGAIKQIIQ